MLSSRKVLFCAFGILLLVPKTCPWWSPTFQSYWNNVGPSQANVNQITAAVIVAQSVERPFKGPSKVVQLFDWHRFESRPQPKVVRKKILAVPSTGTHGNNYAVWESRMKKKHFSICGCSILHSILKDNFWVSI